MMTSARDDTKKMKNTHDDINKHCVLYMMKDTHKNTHKNTLIDTMTHIHTK